MLCGQQAHILPPVADFRSLFSAHHLPILRDDFRRFSLPSREGFSVHVARRAAALSSRNAPTSLSITPDMLPSFCYCHGVFLETANGFYLSTLGVFFGVRVQIVWARCRQFGDSTPGCFCGLSSSTRFLPPKQRTIPSCRSSRFTIPPSS